MPRAPRNYRHRPFAGMPFGAYLRRRKSFTAAGHELRETCAAMPEEIADLVAAQSWLRERGLLRTNAETLVEAWTQYREIQAAARAAAKP